MPATVFRRDSFAPVLLNSKTLEVSLEQDELIQEILETACSDSRFAQKAYTAIRLVLTAGQAKIPTVSNVNPSTAVAGSGPVSISVIGTNFDSGSKVLVAGSEASTTFVSATQLD